MLLVEPVTRSYKLLLSFVRHVDLLREKYCSTCNRLGSLCAALCMCSLEDTSWITLFLKKNVVEKCKINEIMTSRRGTKRDVRLARKLNFKL